MHKRRNQGVLLVKVRDGMSRLVLTIGPAHTLRQAARMMSARRIGAAALIDPEHAGTGILTESHILHSVSAGGDPDAGPVAQQLHESITVAAPAAGTDHGLLLRALASSPAAVAVDARASRVHEDHSPSSIFRFGFEDHRELCPARVEDRLVQPRLRGGLVREVRAGLLRVG